MKNSSLGSKQRIESAKGCMKFKNSLLFSRIHITKMWQCLKQNSLIIQTRLLIKHNMVIFKRRRRKKNHLYIIRGNKIIQAKTSYDLQIFFFLLRSALLLTENWKKEEKFRLLQIVVFFWLINCIYKLHQGEIISEGVFSEQECTFFAILSRNYVISSVFGFSLKNNDLKIG